MGRRSGIWVDPCGDGGCLCLEFAEFHGHAEDCVAASGLPDRVRFEDWWRYPETAALLATEWTKHVLSSVRISVTEWLHMTQDHCHDRSFSSPMPCLSCDCSWSTHLPLLIGRGIECLADPYLGPVLRCVRNRWRAASLCGGLG